MGKCNYKPLPLPLITFIRQGPCLRNLPPRQPSNPSRQLAGQPATLGILDRPQTVLGSWQACLFCSYGLPKATLGILVRLQTLPSAFGLLLHRSLACVRREPGEGASGTCSPCTAALELSLRNLPPSRQLAGQPATLGILDRPKPFSAAGKYVEPQVVGAAKRGQGTWDRELGTGKWGAGNWGQQTGDSDLGTGNWGQQTEQATGGRELGQGTWAGNWGQQTGDREFGTGTGDRELGAGNWGGTGGQELGAANWGQGTWDRELGAANWAGNWGQGTGTGNLGRELGAANWRQGTWDRELGTGNWGQGTGGQGTGGSKLDCLFSSPVPGLPLLFLWASESNVRHCGPPSNPSLHRSLGREPLERAARALQP